MKKALIFLCGLAIALNAQIKQKDVDPSVIKEDMQIIDVRTPAEWQETGTIKNVYKVSFTKDDKKTPNPNFFEELKATKIDLNKPVYVICKSGKRGEKAADVLDKKGVKDVTNLKGGMDKLIADGYKTEK